MEDQRRLWSVLTTRVCRYSLTYNPLPSPEQAIKCFTSAQCPGCPSVRFDDQAETLRPACLRPDEGRTNPGLGEARGGSGSGHWRASRSASFSIVMTTPNKSSAALQRLRSLNPVRQHSIVYYSVEDSFGKCGVTHPETLLHWALEYHTLILFS